MELQVAVQYFSFLKGADLSIVTFVTIHSQMDERESTRYQPCFLLYIWHVARSLCKNMLQVSKEGG